MRRTSLVFRLFVMAFMALGLGALLASPAAAQSTQVGQCQTIIEGVINQQPCTIEIDSNGQCQVVVGEDIFQNAQGCGLQSCPRQIIAEGNIFQFQCGDPVPTATTAPPTATTVAPTATTAPPTATTVAPTATTVAPTATTVAPTATTVAPTATSVAPTATVHPDDDGGDGGDDDGGQANPSTQAPSEPDDTEMEVSVLPSTGQGSDGGGSNSANLLLIGAMGTVLTLGAVAMRLRNNS